MCASLLLAALNSCHVCLVLLEGVSEVISTLMRFGQLGLGLKKKKKHNVRRGTPNNGNLKSYRLMISFSAHTSCRAPYALVRVLLSSFMRRLSGATGG